MIEFLFLFDPKENVKCRFYLIVHLCPRVEKLHNAVILRVSEADLIVNNLQQNRAHVTMCRVHNLGLTTMYWSHNRSGPAMLAGNLVTASSRISLCATHQRPRTWQQYSTISWSCSYKTYCFYLWPVFTEIAENWDRQQHALTTSMQACCPLAWQGIMLGAKIFIATSMAMAQASPCCSGECDWSCSLFWYPSACYPLPSSQICTLKISNYDDSLILQILEIIPLIISIVGYRESRCYKMEQCRIRIQDKT